MKIIDGFLLIFRKKIAKDALLLLNFLTMQLIIFELIPWYLEAVVQCMCAAYFYYARLSFYAFFLIN